MFNAERLLGQLVGDVLSGQLGGGKGKSRRSGGLGGLLGRSSGGELMGGLSGGTKAKLGLGLLGIAVAAYQHYQTPAAAPQATMGGAMPPPPPPGPSPAAAAAPPSAVAAADRRDHAMHLLRAMITAAHSDGLIDPQERASILDRARAAGLDAESLQALDAEVRAPLTLDQLAVRTPAGLRAEVYAAALIAITADTDQEREFLDRLAQQLELDGAACADIHAQLGLDAAH